MSFRLNELMGKLEQDPWRTSSPFSPPLSLANEEIFQAASKSNRHTIELTLSNWLLKHQPCVFGRIAARKNLISFCIITEADIQQGDPHVRDLIQSARLAWRQDAFEGRKSAFVISIISERLATAVPDINVREFARTLTSFYLARDIDPDQIYNDELFLEIPTNQAIFQWAVGVNYFSAQGDGRWWQDHRIPGGIALSMNSVGHMVKSAILLHHTKDLELALGIETDSSEPVNLESLPRALEFAMKTILNASTTASGQATFLFESSPAGRKCPVEISENLKKYDCIGYGGYYHTDVTVPSTYFQPDVVKPEHQPELRLDFSYLIDNRFENPDHITVGIGRRIRAAGDRDKHQRREKLLRLVPKIVEPRNSAALSELLAKRDQTKLRKL